MTIDRAQTFNLRHPEGGSFFVYQWGDSRNPAVLFHHATGFCGPIWKKIAQGLSSAYCVYALDARGHGRTQGLVQRETSWELFGSDLAWLGRQIAETRGVGSFEAVVGHSLGGVSAMIASTLEPRLFPRVCAIEPVVLDATSVGGRNRFSLRARMRRQQFVSRQEAAAHLRSQDNYSAWDHDVFADFLQDGLVEEEGGGVRLRCSPELEAQIYELGTTPAWECHSSVALAVLYSRKSRFLSGYETLRKRCASVEFHSVEAGHLVPMETPEETLAWLGTLLALV